MVSLKCLPYIKWLFHLVCFQRNYQVPTHSPTNIRLESPQTYFSFWIYTEEYFLITEIQNEKTIIRQLPSLTEPLRSFLCSVH